MNSNTSAESPILSMEQLSIHSNSRPASPASTVSPSEPIAPTPTRLTIIPIGGSASNLVLLPSEPALSPMPVTHSATPSSNLKSHAKPQEIQESLPVEPRILRVTKEDIQALCQVIEEFKEQCIF